MASRSLQRHRAVGRRTVGRLSSQLVVLRTSRVGCRLVARMKTERVRLPHPDRASRRVGYMRSGSRGGCSPPLTIEAARRRTGLRAARAKHANSVTSRQSALGSASSAPRCEFESGEAHLADLCSNPLALPFTPVELRKLAFVGDREVGLSEPVWALSPRAVHAPRRDEAR